MSEELRILAHAVKALADSNLGQGNVLRESLVTAQETNRILGLIHDQNADILGQMEMLNKRQGESEREFRVLRSTVSTHAQHIKRLEAQGGIPVTEQLSGPATIAR